MVFERMIGTNIIRKVRQLESLSKTSFLANTCKNPEFGRTSTTLAGINRCLNSNVTNNGNTRFLTKLSATTATGKQLSRQSSTATGDHVRLWVLEKATSVALPILIPAALIMETPVLDALLSVLVVIHTHWGLEAIITDYARPSVVGKVLPFLLHISLYALSVLTLGGLIMLIHNGPGVTRAIKDAWAIGKETNPGSPA